MPTNPYEPPKEESGCNQSHGDEFRRVEGTRFFSKTNHRANPLSLSAWALAGAVPPPLLVWFGVQAAFHELDWPFKIAILACASLVGATIAFIVEWQVE